MNCFRPLCAFCTALFALPLILSAEVPLRPAPEPYRPEKWNEIETYIRNNWHNFVEKNPDFPVAYLYGLNPGTLYYWDLYFHNEGLLRCGETELARNNLDCMIWQIDKLGFIPNASGWGEDRSQTPCFSMSVRRYWELTPGKDTAWLHRAYRAVLKEYEFWTNTDGNTIEDHSTPVKGLQRYGHHSDTAALATFYDRVLKGRFGLDPGTPRETKIRMAAHRMAEAECMDFTPRFEGRCMDYIPVDLNSYLYGYEKDLAYYERELDLSDGRKWEQKAEKRARLIEKYCWDEMRGLYLDYDFVNRRRSPVGSLAALMPLHFGFAPARHAERVRENLPLFDSPGGLVVCETTPQKIAYQWGHSAVWAPIQQLAIEAMLRYGYREEAQHIALKWLNTVTRNYLDPQPATHRPFKYGDGTRHPGFLWEKYTRDGRINDDEYPCSFMLGWTASAYLVALETVRGAERQTRFTTVAKD